MHHNKGNRNTWTVKMVRAPSKPCYVQPAKMWPADTMHHATFSDLDRADLMPKRTADRMAATFQAIDTTGGKCIFSAEEVA